MTMLVPTDAAIQGSVEKIDKDLVPDAAKLATMLKNFMFPVRLKKKKLIELKSTPPQNCNGKACSIKGMKEEITHDGNKLFNTTDVKCSNGIIHEIEEFELPPV
jgi:uncharacterized surface protein with fasciclin (FAS1) repeats